MSDDHDESEKVIKKRIILLSVFLAVAGGAGVYLWTMPGYYQNYAPEQPIPFSHKIHAGKFQIPCLYCHGSAEYSEFAAVPGAETCMNCHSVVKVDSPWIKQLKEAYDSKKPIAWVKVHVLPDFVFFNHSRHVGAGIECQTCHGPVQEMDKVYQYAPLNMGWCVNCHRNDDYLTSSRHEWSRKSAELKGASEMPAAFDMLKHPEVQNADLSCSTCHR